MPDTANLERAEISQAGAIRVAALDHLVLRVADLDRAIKFYGEVLGLTTEVVVGPEEGIPRASAVRCDFLMLMFKDKLTTRTGKLSLPKLLELNRALAQALDLPATTSYGVQRIRK